MRTAAGGAWNIFATLVLALRACGTIGVKDVGADGTAGGYAKPSGAVSTLMGCVRTVASASPSSSPAPPCGEHGKVASAGAAAAAEEAEADAAARARGAGRLGRKDIRGGRKAAGRRYNGTR